MIVRLATTMDKLAARLTIIAVSRADHFIEKRKIVKNHPRGILPSPSSRQTHLRAPSHPSLSVCVHILLLPVNPMPPTESVQRDMI